MSDSDGPEAIFRQFLEVFARGDRRGMRALLDDGFVGRVTAADGGTKAVDPDQYVEAVVQMDVPTANLQLSVNDVTLVGDDTVLVLVEVRAARGGRTLHNFSGQLATIANGRITELSMVDALPEESDRFWSS